MNSRQSLLGAVLILTLAATAWTAWNDQEDAKPTEGIKVKTETKITLTTSHAATRLPARLATVIFEISNIHHGSHLFREPLPVEVGNLFDVDIPRDEVSASLASARAIAPFPYTYVGKMIDAEGVSVFLTAGDINVVAKVHDVIDRQWQIEQIKLPRMIIKNLLTKRRSTIMIEEKSE